VPVDEDLVGIVAGDGSAELVLCGAGSLNSAPGGRCPRADDTPALRCLREHLELGAELMCEVAHSE
jgi:hypothetical protein